MPQAVELKNPVIERMRAGDVSLGMIVRLARSGDIARIAKTTGHDFIFIDRQHALFSLETVGHIAQAALGCGVAPLVRVRSCHDLDTSLILDNGATGIIFPDINSAADAQRAVEACKFAPVGKRSVSARLSGVRSAAGAARRERPGAQCRDAGGVHDRDRRGPRQCR